MARPKSSPRPIVDKAFARRFEEACSLSEHVPEFNDGRLRYIQEELAKHGISVSRETVRKWSAGETRPRRDKMRALAQILRVDEAWFAMGVKPTLAPVKEQVANVEGSINLVAGIFAMNGANYAWPSEPDESLHFVTIYKSRQYSVYVAAGEVSSSGVKFYFPNKYEGKLLIGFIKRGPMTFDLYRIPENMVSKAGKKKGGYIEVSATESGDVLLAAGVRAPKMVDLSNLDQ